MTAPDPSSSVIQLVSVVEETLGPGLVMAPGTGVLSCLPGNRYGITRGTSTATPLAAGVVALVFGKLRADGGTPDPSLIQSLLYENAVDLGVEGVDKFTGCGMIKPESLFAAITRRFDSFFCPLESGTSNPEHSMSAIDSDDFGLVSDRNLGGCFRWGSCGDDPRCAMPEHHWPKASSGSLRVIPARLDRRGSCQTTRCCFYS